jgi:hypothetical protein
MAAPEADDLGFQRRSMRDTDTDQREPDAGEGIDQLLTDADSQVLVHRSE